jgi:O-antigen/teichoic acid export membrane protein
VTSTKSALDEVIGVFRNRFSHERMGGRVARGSIKSILVNGSGAAASLLVQVALARLLGAIGYGTYLLVLGWLAVAQLFGKLELDVTSVRFVGSYAATGRWSLLHGFLRSSRRAVLATSFAIAVLAAIGIVLFSDRIAMKHPDLPRALLVACPLLPITTLLILEGAVLQGFHRYVESQFPLNVLRPVVFGILILFAYFVAKITMTPTLAVAGNMVAAFAALVVTFFWRRRAIPPDVRQAEPAYARGTWARTAYPLFTVSLGQVIISQQADVIVVGTMLSTADAAVYGAASQLTMPLVLAASSVTFVAQSMIADLYSRDPARLQNLIRAVTWLSAALIVPIALLLVLFGPQLLAFYGPRFVHGHSVLIVLTVAQVVIGLVGSLAGYLLTMTAHEREAAIIISVSAAFNLGLAIYLTPRYGAVGTASATLVAAVARALALRIYIRRAMGLRIPAFRASTA